MEIAEELPNNELPYLCREGYCPHPEHTGPDRRYVEEDGIVFIEEQDEDYDPVSELLDQMAVGIIAAVMVKRRRS